MIANAGRITSRRVRPTPKKCNSRLAVPWCSPEQAKQQIDAASMSSAGDPAGQSSPVFAHLCCAWCLPRLPAVVFNRVRVQCRLSGSLSVD